MLCDTKQTRPFRTRRSLFSCEVAVSVRFVCRGSLACLREYIIVQLTRKAKKQTIAVTRQWLDENLNPHQTWLPPHQPRHQHHHQVASRRTAPLLSLHLLHHHHHHRHHCHQQLLLLQVPVAETHNPSLLLTPTLSFFQRNQRPHQLQPQQFAPSQASTTSSELAWLNRLPWVL